MMGWETDEESIGESIEVESVETVEDTDPALYRMRAKMWAKQGEYDEADKEYDKSIEYSDYMTIAYIMKIFFWLGQGKNVRSIKALVIATWKILYRYIDFILLWLFIMLSGVDSGGNLSFIITSFFSFFIVIERAIRATRFQEDTEDKEVLREKYKHNLKNAIIIGLVLAVASLGGLGILYYIVASLILFALCIIAFFIFAINILAMILRKIRNIFVIINGSEYSGKESSENVSHPKQEYRAPNTVSQQEIIQSRQETPQREPSFMSADEGMLLVLDVPIQKGKVSIDKVIVTKDMVKLPINGKNIQIDVSCKKFEVIQDIEFRNCKRYDIKKGSLVYVLVAMVEYCINIWNKEWNDNTESACEKLTVQLNQKLNPYGIKTRLSKRGWQFLENNVLITFEDAIYLLNSKRV